MFQNTPDSKKCFISEKIKDELGKAWSRLVCKDLDINHEYNGHYYCVLHFPDNKKHYTTDYLKILEKKIQNDNDCFFYYVYFSDFADFLGRKFPREADFRHAVFLQGAEFYDAKFPSGATFMGANFNQRISFYEAEFINRANFSETVFEENSRTYFGNTTFKKEVTFQDAILKGYITFKGQNEKAIFEGSNAGLVLENVFVERDDAIKFTNVRLQPNWFINIDARKIIFLDVDWKNADGTLLKAELESKTLQSRKELLRNETEQVYKKHKISKDLIYENIVRPNQLLAIACRQLSDNAEENNRYEEASDFRYMAMEAQRFTYQYPFFAPQKLHWWYWFTSGYGEIWRRALLVLLGIWLLFTIIYISPFSSFIREDRKVENQQVTQEQKNESLYPGEALVYSLGVITLQKPEPRPYDSFTKTIVILETILGPLQFALLALAIRRKFMR